MKEHPTIQSYFHPRARRTKSIFPSAAYGETKSISFRDFMEELTRSLTTWGNSYQSISFRVSMTMGGMPSQVNAYGGFVGLVSQSIIAGLVSPRIVRSSLTF